MTRTRHRGEPPLSKLRTTPGVGPTCFTYMPRWRYNRLICTADLQWDRVFEQDLTTKASHGYTHLQRACRAGPLLNHSVTQAPIPATISPLRF
ncbi:hypothetical protein AVEN_240694-1 [Araneus ventricosus]|uniref:Uncharacterized protein n=1 Tax=Araneus ventricosus TaxID=182803 RepID=A0A4Y2S2R3_ARAVE|nr:hypothetical protein AVEN_240694-1 [Araneus ventricosus]